MGTSAIQAAHLSESLLITARLNGAQEVPMVMTDAEGLASFRLNATRDTMCIDFVGINLSGPITGIHVHDGVAGTNGGVVLNLTPFLNGNRVSAVVTGSDLSPEKLAKYLTEGYYLNVHTAANPNGEIRGQLKLETDKGYLALLDDEQQVHSVNSDALGLASFVVGMPGETMEVKMITTGLSGPITMAHLHYGAPGVAGGVAVDLTPFIMGNSIMGMVDISGVADLMDSLQAGSIYVNVHTAANPNGEIRGQLMMPEGLYIDGMLDVAQETHTVVGSMAKGVAVAIVHPMLDSITTYCLTDSLSGNIVAAHYHQGAVGVSGGVLIDLGTGIDQNRIMATTAVGGNMPLNALLRGEAYINIHTMLNAAGEIRGQMYRAAREGYTLSLDGGQEVPAVMTNGQGTGMVSIDRNRTNAHYMMVVSDLSGPLTMAHFHNAAAGANGGVVYNLTPSFSGMDTTDAAYGYWTDMDMMMPFMAMNEMQFRNDEIYVNIHTMMHPSGEVRGQVMRGGTCMNVPTSTRQATWTAELSVFPNPVSDQLFVTLETPLPQDGQITLSNLLGQVIYQEQIPAGSVLNAHGIDARDLPTGMYVLTLRAGEQQFSTKLVKP